jgi:glyoxylase-like metal-dependent hydrolase (beta-lactamase superfamily II)
MKKTSVDKLLVTDHVYQVAGGTITAPDDASAFIIKGSDPVLIDTGAGRSIKRLVENIEAVGVDPKSVKRVVLTHNHIDHIGGMEYLKSNFDVKFFMHELDAGAVEMGDGIVTAASMYGVRLDPINIDVVFSDAAFSLDFDDTKLVLLHTPGHTPGSVSPYIDIDGLRVLFAQDVHGPFMDVFGSDIGMWRKSMEKLKGLKPDVLCEGHFGIFRPRESALAYIDSYLRQYSH